MLSSKKIFSVLSLLFLIGILLGNLSKVHAATYEEQVVSLINTERTKQGLTPYNYSDKLFQAAQKHNNLMFDCSKTYGTSPCFVHTVTQLGELGLMDRVKATGYNPQAVAENIGWGYLTPSAMVTGWMNSSGHKANILGSYKDIGCDYLDALNGSYKGMYWTCDFGKSFGSTTSSPSPTPTRTPTPTTKPTSSPTPTLTPTRTPTPTPGSGSTVTPTPSQKPWYCAYIPTFPGCQ